MKCFKRRTLLISIDYLNLKQSSLNPILEVEWIIEELKLQDRFVREPSFINFLLSLDDTERFNIIRRLRFIAL